MKTEEKDIIIRELLGVISNLRAEINDLKKEEEELSKPKRTMGGPTFVSRTFVRGVDQPDQL